MTIPLCNDLIISIISYLPAHERLKLILYLKYGKYYSRIKVAVCKNIYLNNHFISGSSKRRYEKISYYNNKFDFIKNTYVLREEHKVIKRTKCYLLLEV